MPGPNVKIDHEYQQFMRDLKVRQTAPPETLTNRYRLVDPPRYKQAINAIDPRDELLDLAKKAGFF